MIGRSIASISTRVIAGLQLFGGLLFAPHYRAAAGKRKSYLGIAICDLVAARRAIYCSAAAGTNTSLYHRPMDSLPHFRLKLSPRAITSRRRGMSEVNASPGISSSACVGHLVQRALTFFDTNREAAWRCLRDASMLLGAEPAESRGDAPASDIQVRPGGLAAWQAKRA